MNSERFFRLLLGSAPNVIVLMDNDGRIAHCSRSFFTEAGTEGAVIEGKYYKNALPALVTSAFYKKFSGAFEYAVSNRAASSFEIDAAFLYARAPKSFSVTLAPLADGSDAGGVMAIFNDITEKNEMLIKAAQMCAAKTDFLTNISHEIRTPMNTINGMNELILRENLPDKARQYAQLAKRAGGSMLALINDILDFSKIEAGRFELYENDFSLVSFINDITGLALVKLEDRPIEFTLNVDCSIPSYLTGDEARLRQIFVNLMTNAVKYTRAGYINLSVGGEISGNNYILKADFTDSGIGIKPEESARLFENFARIDVEKNRGIEGSGLGLSITKELCRLMGGSVSFESVYGSGSKFTVTLPLKYAGGEKLAEVINPGEKSVLLYEPRGYIADSCVKTFENLGVLCAVTGSRQIFYKMIESGRYPFIFIPLFLYETERLTLETMKIKQSVVLIADYNSRASELVRGSGVRAVSSPLYALSAANILNGAGNAATGAARVEISFTAESAEILIVDDISTNLVVAESLMAPYGMRIDVARSGLEAIEAVSGKTYDIIFMDHSMPEMDGIEATKIIRGAGYTRPIIALTANAVSGMRDMFLQNEMNDFLSKPIGIAELNAILKKWVPKEKQESKSDGSDKTKKPGGINIEIDGIDVKAGVFLSGGSESRYLKVLGIFYNDVEEKIGSLKEFAENGDYGSYRVLVHGIKGALLNIGANAAAGLAQTLEEAAKNESAGFISNNNDIFIKILDALLKKIAAVITGNRDGEKKLDAANRERAVNILMDLNEALAEFDAGAINRLVAELEETSAGTRYSEAAQTISRLVLLSEYDEASAEGEILSEKINSDVA